MQIPRESELRNGFLEKGDQGQLMGKLVHNPSFQSGRGNWSSSLPTNIVNRNLSQLCLCLGLWSQRFFPSQKMPLLGDKADRSRRHSVPDQQDASFAKAEHPSAEVNCRPINAQLSQLAQLGEEILAVFDLSNVIVTSDWTGWNLKGDEHHNVSPPTGPNLL